MTRALFVVGHGTRSPAGTAECEALIDQIRAMRPSLPVAAGHLELCRPTIPEGLDRLLAQGANDVTALPLVLFAARHAKHDIPAALATERARHPQLRLHQGDPLGVSPRLVDVVSDRLRARVRPDRRHRTAVVLVRAGSSDPAARPDLDRVARLLARRGPYPVVETAFAGIAEPRLDAVLHRLHQRGHRHVAVVPYLLFSGELATRVARQGAAFARAHPDLALTTTAHLGPDPRIAAVALQRHDEARAGSRPVVPAGR